MPACNTSWVFFNLVPCHEVLSLLCVACLFLSSVPKAQSPLFPTGVWFFYPLLTSVVSCMTLRESSSQTKTQPIFHAASPTQLSALCPTPVVVGFIFVCVRVCCENYLKHGVHRGVPETLGSNFVDAAKWSYAAPAPRQWACLGHFLWMALPGTSALPRLRPSYGASSKEGGEKTWLGFKTASNLNQKKKAPFLTF